MVSVSLRSIVHSYNNSGMHVHIDMDTFPSPYGVSFILIKVLNKLYVLYKRFPSPYGVSFILIVKIRHYHNLSL